MVYDDTVKPEEKRGTGDLMPKKLFIARESPSATLPFIRVQTRSNPVFFPDRVLRLLRPAGYAFDAADEVPFDRLQYSISSSKHLAFHMRYLAARAGEGHVRMSISMLDTGVWSYASRRAWVEFIEKKIYCQAC